MISGFTSATSVIIVVTQLKGVLGLRYKSHSILELLQYIVTHLVEVNLADTLIGLGCIFALTAIKVKASRCSRVPPLKGYLLQKVGSLPTKNPRTKKALWFLSISRNALVVFTCALIAYLYETKLGRPPFRLSSHVPSGLPTVQFPPFSITSKNETITFFRMVHDLGSGIVVAPVIAVLANIAIAKSFAAGKMVDATQEMVALGLCNIFGSFVQAMPATGAFTRSAVAHASGVCTPLQGVYSGSIILLALSFLTPFFYYIPRSTLSAVLICAVSTLIDYGIVVKLWRCNSKYCESLCERKVDVVFVEFDLVLLMTTFSVSVFLGVELGLLAGTVISALSLLKPWTRPKIDIVQSMVELKFG